MHQPSSTMPLGIEGFTYADLHVASRLHDLYEVFCRRVEAADPQFWSEWNAYRADPAAPRTPQQKSELIVRMAPHVSRFVATLFRVQDAAGAINAQTTSLDVLFRFKADFVRKRALPLVKGGAHVHRDPADLAVVDELARPWADLDPELAIATAGCALLDREAAARANGTAEEKAGIAVQADALKRWCAGCLHDPGFRQWVIFRFPETLDYMNLVQVQRPRPDLPEAMIGPDDRLRRRDGFKLTDSRWQTREVLSEIHYCVLCHERDKDSCSKGLRDKEGRILTNPLAIPLPGCPLDEKISEMHMVRKTGDAIGALAIVAIDNPMCPGTGHRICNDCMKSCIYQKQEPVNIPQIETGVLTDVLRMPWGVEIYGLLTRWNPLNVYRPYALPYNGKNVLVVGLGPAGYTLAHHLLNEGFGVVAIDGLKIEPLPASLIGADAWPPQPVEHWKDLETELDRRVLVGFGGVAEYGITVRWDKNFLTALHVALARRGTFRIYGGTRFGGTLDAEEAFALGFHHIAIAAGAGKPTIIELGNNLINGVRKASDFLMALQLTGAGKKDSIANLQLRLPALVIGGGLTGIDTTTEAAAYYPVQVEKFLDRWETLAREGGEDPLWRLLDADEAEIAREFLEHGRAVRAERARAAAAGEHPDLERLVAAWGGVSLVYRKSMQDSPAYRLNHEEITKFLEEGVTFIENLAPRKCEPDERGSLAAVILEQVVEENGQWHSVGERVRLPARTLLVAAGTSPNITYERERPGSFEMDIRARAFRSHVATPSADGKSFTLHPATPGVAGFFTSYER